MAVTRQVGSQTDAKPSNSDLSDKNFRFAKRVVASGESRFDLAGNGEQVAGVISEGKALGLHTSVDTGNQLKVAAAAAAINPGDYITSDANGRAKVAASGQIIAGQAISATNALDELVEIDMTKVGPGTVA